MADDEDEKTGLTEDEAILKEAKRRFAECEAWEAHARTMFVEDMKFAHGDSDNNDQWDGTVIKERAIDNRPSLTINKTRQHCLQIINDAKQNKPGIVVHPATDDASYQAAQAFEDVVRYIERQSLAEQAYDRASENQVYGGIGYVRVLADYADNTSFDQELRIKGVKDSLTIYMDPNANEPDKSDSKFAFVFDDMPKETFKSLHKEHSDKVHVAPLGNYDGWIGDNHVRVAEYWRVESKKDKIVSYVLKSTGEQITSRKSLLDKAMLAQIKNDPSYRERDTEVESIICYKIAADTIIGRMPWLGRWIPIVPAIGEETVVDGQMDRKGHTRYLKDPQRMYNWHTSSATEAVALQTKTPYIGAAKAFEGYEEYWANSNKENLPFLPFNHRDDQGQEIPKPERIQPAVMPSAMVKGMEIAQQEMMMASGQYQSQFGENENATSGKAINERQRQGDNATYHFVDNHAVMIRQVGRILVDAIPKYYDTTRILRIRGQDGSLKTMKLDPNAQQAIEQKKGQAENEVELIFNPNVGKYAVDADVGPGFATRRQEAWNAISQILSQNKELTNVIGDLLFRNADFPNADVIADRLARLVPAHVKGEAPPPEMQKMQADMEQLHGQMQKMIEQMSIDKLKMSSKDAQDMIGFYDAQTKRLVAEGNAGPYVTAEQVQPLIMQTIMQMLNGQGGPQPSQDGGGASPAPMEPQQPAGLPAPAPAQSTQQPMPNGAMAQ